MVRSPTSGEAIDGNFLRSLDDLRGEEFSDDALSGDDVDCDDLAREGRGFRGVGMVAWLLYTEGATWSLVVGSSAFEDKKSPNVDTALCC